MEPEVRLIAQLQKPGRELRRDRNGFRNKAGYFQVLFEIAKEAAFSRELIQFIEPEFFFINVLSCSDDFIER